MERCVGIIGIICCLVMALIDIIIKVVTVRKQRKYIKELSEKYLNSKK